MPPRSESQNASNAMVAVNKRDSSYVSGNSLSFNAPVGNWTAAKSAGGFAMALVVTLVWVIGIGLALTAVVLTGYGIYKLVQWVLGLFGVKIGGAKRDGDSGGLFGRSKGKKKTSVVGGIASALLDPLNIFGTR